MRMLAELARELPRRCSELCLPSWVKASVMCTVGFASILTCVLSIKSAHAQSNVQDEIRKVDRLNAACRGGLATHELTMEVCATRDRQLRVVEKLGWCWGPREAPTFQKRWQMCQSEFDKSNWLPLGARDGIAYHADLDTTKTKDGLRARIVADGVAVPLPLKNFVFTLDCKGSFRNEVLAEQYRVWESVKPGSMIAEASGVLCELAGLSKG